MWAVDGEGSPYPPQMDRSCDGERSLLHSSSDGPPPSFVLTFYLFCLQSRGLKVVECVRSDDDAKDAASLAEAMLQFLGGGPRSSGSLHPNNRLPPKSPRPLVPPNDEVEPMQECNPNPGTGSQEGSESEDPKGSSDEKEVSKHAKYDGQVPEDDIVDEDPLEEGKVEGTPSAARSGPLEDDLDFAPVDDTLGNPEVEELVQKKPKKSKKNKEVPNEEVGISEALTKKQNTGRKKKGKKVATTFAKNDDTESMPTEVVLSTPPNIVLVLGDGEGSLSLAAEGAGSQGQKKVERKKRKSEAAKLHPGDDGLQNVQTKVSAKRSTRVPKPKLKVREGAEVSGAAGIRGGGRGSSKGRGGATGSGRGRTGAATKVPLPIDTSTTLDVGSQGPEPSHSRGLSGGGTRSAPTNPSLVKRSSAKELASDVHTRLQSQSEAAEYVLSPRHTGS
jgi:hypothetical protein